MMRTSIADDMAVNTDAARRAELRRGELELGRDRDGFGVRSTWLLGRRMEGPVMSVKASRDAGDRSAKN